MAHVVTLRARLAGQGWSIRLAALGAVLAACAALHTPGAHAAEDEMVPQGQWTLRARVTQEHQEAAIATDRRRHPLVDWLMHQPGLGEDLSGEVTRDVTATETVIGYGISDTWNLNLTVPFLLIRQQSTLDTDSGNALAQAAVDRLKTETVSGLGNVRLMSLHRPLYSDTTGIILGWGFSMPGGPPQNDYLGRATLGTRVPYHTLNGLFHITTYPLSVNRARLDIRLEFDLGFDVGVDTPEAKGVRLHPPNTGSASVRWEQELQPVGYAVFLRHVASTQSFLDNVGQGDPTQETRLGVELLWGNLVQLEEKPTPWPYQAGFQIDHLMQGFNVPASSRYTLFLRTFF